MSCDYAVRNFLHHIVGTHEAMQQFCRTHQLEPTDLVSAFKVFYETMRTAAAAGDNVPTEQQESYYQRVVDLMEQAGISMPSHSSSNRMKVALSSLYTVMARVAADAESKGEPDEAVDVILHLARANRSLNAVRPPSQVSQVLPPVNPYQIGLDRAAMEAIADHNPVAAALLNATPVPSPDWNADAMRQLAERVAASGQRIEVPSPSEVRAFLQSRIPRPAAALAPNPSMVAAAERLSMHLETWGRLIRDGYIAVDGTSSLRVPSAQLGSLMSFTFFGPPGTGKSEFFRQVAACMPWTAPDGSIRYGVPYFAMEVPLNGSAGEVLGRPSYGEDGKLFFTPTPAVIVGMCGGVVVFEEIARSRELIAAIQAAMELMPRGQREIRIPSPEAGFETFSLHPTTLVGATYNPGMDGFGWNLPSAFVDRTTLLSFEPPTAEQVLRQASTTLVQIKGQELTASEQDQIRAIIQLISELNQMVRDFDPRAPGIELRRATTLSWLAMTGNIDQMRWQLMSALPPREQPGADALHDALENLILAFRSRLLQRDMQHRRS